MLTASDERLLQACAYVPEHLPGYVCSITGAEPCLLDGWLCYRSGSTLVFIGFPIPASPRQDALAAGLDRAVAELHPAEVAVVAAALPEGLAPPAAVERDRYYRLALTDLVLPGKVRNMVRRASRDLEVEVGRTLTAAHRRLIDDFLVRRPVSDDVRFIYRRIPDYVAAVETARVFSARTRRGELAAFDVAEFGAEEWAFYQFNLRSGDAHVPGACDLLLHEIVGAARKQGQRYLNLGLGINPGVERFKANWGGVPFLDYASCRYRPRRRGLFDMLVRGL
jgi:hypothetical protein